MIDNLEAASAPVSPSQPPSAPNRKSTAVIAVLSILVLACFSGAGAIFYYYNFLAQSPEKFFNQALDNLKNFNSGTVTYQITIDSQPKELSPEAKISQLAMIAAEPMNFKAKMKQDFEKQEGFLRSSTELTLEVPMGGQLPLIGSISYSPKISLISADKENLYAKLNGFGQLLFFDLSEINDKWIKINFKNAQQSYGLKIATSSSPESSRPIDWLNAVIEAYKVQSFMDLTVLAEETVDGEKCHHFKGIFNKETFKNFVIALQAEIKKQNPDLISNEESYLAGLDQNLENVKIEGEVWIGKKSRIFKKISLPSVFEDEQTTARFELEVALTNYNQPVLIEAPGESVPFEEIMQKVMGQMMGSFGLETGLAQSSTTDTLSDVREVQSGLEEYANQYGRYPFPPTGKGFVFNDVFCLGSKGFGLAPKECPELLLNFPPLFKSRMVTYEYFLCNEKSYIITFSLLQDAGGIKAGKKIATADGITDYQQDAIASDCFDSDADGLSNYFENKYGSDPNAQDTDNDTYLDGNEVNNGYNPNGPGKLNQ